ncbi:MAG TPA: alpha/beta hydrolase [Rhizomicrobium sp.]|nr:alpha/beta hydrolase [Rhizomicrobium sp.]
MKNCLAGIALLFLSGPATAAPDAAGDIAGIWQGSANPARVLQLAHKKGGGYRGEVNYLNDTPGTLNGNPVSITRSGQAIKLTFDRREGSFEGVLSADRKSIAGSWSADGKTQPLTFTRASAGFVIDPSPHKTSFVTVAKGVKLEVLDWGGSGPPLVFLPGLGNTAHTFDKFALNFTGKHHVYAITRRGIGLSSIPEPTIANYDADRLGDDVIAVIDHLKLERPVLAGWSIGGEELSSIGSRHSGKVSGLVYLDAGYAYAFYAPGGGLPPGLTPYLDARELRQSLEALTNVAAIRRMEVKPLVDELLQKSLPSFEKDLAVAQMEMKLLPAPAPAPDTQAVKVGDAILGGAHKYTAIKAPVLAFFNAPHTPPDNAPAGVKAFLQAQDALTMVHANAFEAGVPGARVVRLANAEHDVFRTNEAEVTQEMNAFMDQLASKNPVP